MVLVVYYDNITSDLIELYDPAPVVFVDGGGVTVRYTIGPAPEPQTNFLSSYSHSGCFRSPSIIGSLYACNLTSWTREKKPPAHLEYQIYFTVFSLQSVFT